MKVKIRYFFNKFGILSLFLYLANDIFVSYLKNKSTFMISQKSTTKPFIGQYLKGVVLLAVLFWGKSVAGQGWERSYGGNKTDRGNALIQTIDRGYLMVGFSESFGSDNDQDVYVVKTDIEGNVVWSEVFDEGFYEQGNEVIQGRNGNFLIVGMSQEFSTSDRDLYVLSISKSGKFLWSKTYGGAGDEKGLDITLGVDGGYVIIGETTTTNNGESDFFVLKIDDQGNEIWSRTMGTPKDDFGGAITTVNDGYAFAGVSENPIGFDNDILVYRISDQGDVKWSERISSSEIEEANDIITTRDNGLVITGNISNNRDLFIAKYNDSGKRLWSNSYGDPQLAEVGVALSELENGDLVVAGHAELNSINIDFMLAGFSADGDFLWENKTGNIVNTDFSEDIVRTDDGGYAIVGYNSQFLDIFNDLILIKTDGLGNTITSFISGIIFNERCNDFEPQGKLALEGWLVKAESADKTYFGSTDQNGEFNIRVDTGRYNVTVLPVTPYWTTCVPGGYIVNIDQFYDTTKLNFPITAEINCPFLEIDISTPFLAPCSDVIYNVNYCNLGTAVARDAYVEINLDEKLIFESSSKPFSKQEGNKYIFDLGAIGVSDCGNFTINTSLPCDGIAQNQSALVSAHIFPDTVCTEPDPNWDGSSIIVGGQCQEDSLTFFIRNVGQSDMTAPKNAIIVAEDVIFLKGEFNLPAGDETRYNLPKTGATYRIIAEQSEGHPGRSYPTFAIEGCAEEGADFSTGYVLQFQENDQDPYISIDTKEITSSNNAVNLRGYPKGYGEDAIISPNTDVNYTITFSNQGTDTISRVVIRDTLPKGLDIATLMPGASSHPYDFELYDEGILRITFKNISLTPESSAAPQSTSMGYVSFNIAQNPANEPGTIINNSAAIFFENEAPLYTNEISYVVGSYPEFVKENVTVSVDEPISRYGVEIKVQPNPFVESAIFEVLTQNAVEKVDFELYDVTGRLIRKEKFSGKRFEFKRQTLNAGLYFYKVAADGRRINSGKILIQ